jgi:hypothetical protein
MTEDEILFERLRNEFNNLSKKEKENLGKSDGSLKAWIKTTLKKIASDIIDFTVDKIHELVTYLADNFLR